MSLTYNMLETNGMKMVQTYQNSFKANACASESFAEDVSAMVVNRMIEDLIIEVTSNIHRSYKLGYYDHISPSFTDNCEKTPDTVFFPNAPEVKTEHINCPKCNKSMYPTRFASHLGQCMLKSRSSSRLASQRVANNSKECSYGGGSEEEDDWKNEKSKNVKKFDGKRRKDPVRKQKPYKADNPKKDTANSVAQKDIFQSPSNKSIKENVSYNKNSKDTPESEVWISPNKLTPLLREDKIQLFASKCGVKSDHTGKYCGRSLRCHRHTDTERAVARKILSVENSMVVDEMMKTLNIALNSPVSKKKEKQRNNYTKV